VVGIVAGILVVVLAGAAFAGFSYDRAKSSTILPGVTVDNVDVGGMSRAEAAKALAPAIQRFLARPIAITAGSKQWTMTPAELGGKIDGPGAGAKGLARSGSLGWASRGSHPLLRVPGAAPRPPP